MARVVTGGRGQSDRTAAYDAWQQVARSSETSAVLDVARNVVRATGGWSLLVRTLSVTPVYVRVGPSSLVETSVAEGGTYVHVHSTPVRLTAGLDPGIEELTVREVLLHELVEAAPGRLGARIDPGLETELVMDPDVVDEVRAVAAGVPTRSALTPVEGEELRVERGPEEVTHLDDRVLEALGTVEPRTRVTRAVAQLAGIGGRTWPVYSVTGAGDTGAVREVLAQVVARPLVLLVDGEPRPLAEHLVIDDVALVLDGG